MTEYQIVMQVVLFPEVLYLAGKVRHMGIDQKLVDIRRLPGLDMYLPRTRRKPDYFRSDRVLNAGVNIHRMAHPDQFSGQFPDVNTHASGISRTRLTQGGAMDAEYCDVIVIHWH